MKVQHLFRIACLALATTMCTEPGTEPVPEPLYGCSADQQLTWEPCSAGPVRVAGELRFTELSAGPDHTCGLIANGDVYCWGATAGGAVGRATDTRAPARINSTTPFVAVSAGGTHTCAISADRAVYCWGAGEATGFTSFPDTCQSQPCTLTPARTAQALTLRSVRAGQTHTCGIATDGQTWCWGWNVLGEVGSPEISAFLPNPNRVTGGPFQQVEARFRFTCGLTESGELHCWGWGQEGQLGTIALQRCALAIMDLLCSSVPAPAATPVRFSSISLGSAFGCGIENGTIHCWGENGQSQLGRPVSGTGVAPVVTSGGPWVQVAAGYFHACAIRSDRTAHCWGSNLVGGLGTGSTQYATPEPAPVTGGLQFAQLVAGRSHTCGLTPEGVAWCWGSDRFGQLGRGS